MGQYPSQPLAAHAGRKCVGHHADGFYGLPLDFPGFPEALGTGNAHAKVAALQERFAQEINHPRFIPFLALHEFEAWLFSAPAAVEAHFGKANLAEKLRDAVQEAGALELISQGALAEPAARV